MIDLQPNRHADKAHFDSKELAFRHVFRAQCLEQLNRCAHGTPEFCYWRGVCLGFEATDSGTPITIEWAKTVLQAAKEKSA